MGARLMMSGMITSACLTARTMRMRWRKRLVHSRKGVMLSLEMEGGLPAVMDLSAWSWVRVVASLDLGSLS